VPHLIAGPCIDILDMSCVDQCPVDCIYEGNRKSYIQPDECIDCGACVPVCPVEAIHMDRDVPEEEAEYVEDNRRFFARPLPGRDDPLGSPGGSQQTGRVGVDTTLVAAAPKQA
jgi:NAD-dependent dihydropyrimidine dehydrogenase PreA subunit